MARNPPPLSRKACPRASATANFRWIYRGNDVGRLRRRIERAGSVSQIGVALPAPRGSGFSQHLFAAFADGLEPRLDRVEVAGKLRAREVGRRALRGAAAIGIMRGGRRAAFGLALRAG